MLEIEWILFFRNGFVRWMWIYSWDKLSFVAVFRQTWTALLTWETFFSPQFLHFQNFLILSLYSSGICIRQTGVMESKWMNEHKDLYCTKTSKFSCVINLLSESAACRSWISYLFGRNDHHSMRTCQAQNPCYNFQGQGHSIVDWWKPFSTYYKSSKLNFVHLVNDPYEV